MIPTAEEFFREWDGCSQETFEWKLMMIEFAKLHCIEQARVISEKAEVEERNYNKTPMGVENYGQEIQSDQEGIYYGVDKDSILNAYDLDLIK